MIVGHQKQKKILTKAIESKNFPHAIILQGESGLGKKTLIFDFVKKIFDFEGDLINHPDFLFISSEKKEIKISEIKNILERFSLKPYSAPIKVAVVNNAHLMNQESQNSILKIFEEPIGSSLIVLLTDHPEMILSTVRSRAWKINFFPVKLNEIKEHLVFLGCDEKKAEEITIFSFGKPGVAIDFFENPDKIEVRKEKIKKMTEIISPKSPLFKKINFAKELSEEPEEAVETLKIWLSYFRALLQKKIEGVKIDYSFLKIKKSIKEIENSIYIASKTNANLKITLEVLMIKL